ncbi:two-component system, NarL family, response regulator DevR [Friedmanniella luteola]|uniref:Two-component system, NarL family, response regulator DevR n=1 Tax=Friedmanniella luteola TaxID=546871 RepID=A0A1H1ZZI1_9ACTN|nr:response regulator transcription factor [Friedmanniella luteola]SDT39093.1 two-component system, NarL family, response regulator DevR [Friedmanniella luteola]
MDDRARLGTGQIKVFVLDDHAMVRDALTDYINTDPQMTVVGSAGAAEEALAGIAETEPAVAVLDVRLREGNGLEVCREVRDRHPQVRCVLLTSHSEQEARVAARLAGASGYLIKELGGSTLLDGIRTVATGGSLLAEEPVEELQPLVEDLFERRAVTLSDQQHSVLAGALGGASNAQIADATSLSPSDVRGQLDVIFQGLGIGGGRR